LLISAVLCFSMLCLFVVLAMAAISELRLVKNRYGGLSLVYEGRAYKLKRTGKEKKYWLCSKDKQGCKAVICTNLEVTTVIHQNDHIETCPVDEHLAYKMEKKAILKKRSAEETTPIPTIYEQEASAASADPSTACQFPVFKLSSVYAEKQRVLQYTGEYISGRRTVEQFIESLLYITPEPILCGLSITNDRFKSCPFGGPSIALAFGLLFFACLDIAGLTLYYICSSNDTNLYGP
ncbi:hypothetical protein T4A_10617, partial [Trichinella pseudospiralis]